MCTTNLWRPSSPPRPQAACKWLLHFSNCFFIDKWLWSVVRALPVSIAFIPYWILSFCWITLMYIVCVFGSYMRLCWITFYICMYMCESETNILREKLVNMRLWITINKKNNHTHTHTQWFDFSKAQLPVWRNSWTCWRETEIFNWDFFGFWIVSYEPWPPSNRSNFFIKESTCNLPISPLIVFIKPRVLQYNQHQFNRHIKRFCDYPLGNKLWDCWSISTHTVTQLWINMCASRLPKSFLKSKKKKNPHIMCVFQKQQKMLSSWFFVCMLHVSSSVKTTSRSCRVWCTSFHIKMPSRLKIPSTASAFLSDLFSSAPPSLLQPHWNAALETSESLPHISVTPHTFRLFTTLFNVLSCAPGLKWEKVKT